MTPHQALESPALLERINRVAKRIDACKHMPGRDADDIAQQIVLGVLSRAGGFNPARGTAEAFVITAARSAAMDIFRSASRAKRNPRRVRRLTDDAAASLQAPDHTHEDHDDLRVRVRRAVARMDEADADVADDLQRFGPNGARNRLGLDRSQWVQTKDRLRLTLAEEIHEKTSPNPARPAGDGVSNL